MSYRSQITRLCHVCLGVLLTVTATALCQAPADVKPRDDSRPPLEIRFKPSEGLRAREGEMSCAVPQGRDQVFDSSTGAFHIHFKARNLSHSGFEVTKVAAEFKRPVVFRLTGVPSMYGCVGIPLALTVDGKRYALTDVGHDSFHAYERFDRALFLVEQKEGAVTIEFTDKGRALLKPGALVSLKVDTGW